MPLSEREDEYLQNVLAACGERMKELSEWERGFIEDQQKRYDEYGNDIWMSEKQWGVIDRVAEAMGVEK